MIVANVSTGKTTNISPQQPNFLFFQLTEPGPKTRSKYVWAH